MNRKYRTTVIAGNWKMNKTPSEVKGYAEELRSILGSRVKWCDIVICAPFVDLPMAVRSFRDLKVGVGAQNVSQFPSGAYTGEVSVGMLKDAGVKYVIIGHSERRQYFAETDESVNAKVLAALEAGLQPIVCVGESLDQRDRGLTLDFVSCQVKAALCGVAPEKARKVIFAYEPIWAIGTCRTATSEQAEEVCRHIRTIVRGLYGARTARATSVLYGGSMNDQNAFELLAQPDIDGGLIGGASLVPAKFAAIVNAANQE